MNRAGPPPFLERNLLILSGRDPQLARRMSLTEPDRELAFVPSRAGPPVPVRRADGRNLPLHSTFDPVKEGERLAAAQPGGGYRVFLGFGGGYHIAPFLKNGELSRALVVERDPAQFRAALGCLDLSPLLMDLRVSFLVGADLDQVRRVLLESYFPALEGDLQTVTLRSLFENGRAYYQDVVETIRGLIDRIAGDYTVQSRFGRRWFTNTLLNLPRAQGAFPVLQPARRALITGAGPSLEIQMDDLLRRREGATLIATDTSLPALRQAGIIPDLILSIDCQQVTYHHFLQGVPPSVPLLLDLASPPGLARLSERVGFFSSGHPFSQYLAAHWRRFPSLDTTGGNVSYAAVSLAQRLGAEEITLFGVDFSCPGGKSYARGTFLYPFFRSGEDRFQPLEHCFFSFLMRSPVLRRERQESVLRYVSPQMDGYRIRLEELLRQVPARVEACPGRGVPLELPGPRAAVRPPGRGSRFGEPLFSAGAPVSDWRSFLESYLQSISALSPPTGPAGVFLAGLREPEKALWMTMLPAAAALRREGIAGAATPAARQLSGTALLEEVRGWTRGAVLRVLNT